MCRKPLPVTDANRKAYQSFFGIETSEQYLIYYTMDEEAGTAVVHYALTVPGIEGAVSKQLRLQLEGRAAAVDGIE